MSNFDFYLLLGEHPVAYVSCLSIAAMVYFVIFKKIFLSLLDPFSLPLIGSGFSLSVVLFLHNQEVIRPIYFWSFLLTQMAFWCGFFLFQNSRTFQFRYPRSLRLKNEDLFIKQLFLAGVLLDIVCQLLFYAFLGIPLFMDSRLDATSGGGGVGVLLRVVNICRPVSVFIMLSYLTDKHTSPLLKRFCYLYVTFLCVSVFLNGAKSGIMIFVIMLFNYVYIYRKKKPDLYQKLRRNEIRYVLLLLLFPIISIMTRIGSGSFSVGMMELVNRFVAFGDIYWMAYPDDAWLNVDSSRPFQAIFSGILGTFRIVPWSELPNPVGVNLYRLYADTDSIMGPNARHNVFGLIYFGFIGSIVFSFAVGVLAGIIRKWFLNNTGQSLLGALMISLLYTFGCMIETDINMFFSEIGSQLLILPLLFGIAWAFYLVCIALSKDHLNRTLSGS